MHASTHPTTIPLRERDERGFGMAEMMMVMVVVGIMAAIVVLLFGGAKSSTREKEAVSAAAVYAQALASYQSDHANRNAPTSGDARWVGPLDLVDRPYIKQLPDAVNDGRLVVSAQCSAPSGATNAFLAYCPLADPQFEVRVWTRKDASAPWGEPKCIAGNTQTAAPRC